MARSNGELVARAARMAADAAAAGDACGEALGSCWVLR